MTRKFRPTVWTSAILFMGVVLALVPCRAQAVDFTVTTPVDIADPTPGVCGVCDAGGGVCSLRAAVSKANACAGADTIRFAPALDGTPIQLDLPPTEFFPCVGCETNGLIVTQDLTIAGNGPARTIIQQDPANRQGFVFAVSGGATCGSHECVLFNLSGATVRYGGGVPDFELGGIYIGFGTAVTNITDSVISDNRGGGIVRFYGGDVFLDRVTVARNTSRYGGGAYLAGSGFAFSIRNSTFSENSAVPDAFGGGLGGGLYVDDSVYDAADSPTIVNSTFSGNTAVDGCAYYNANSVTRMYDVTVANNCTAASGAAALVAAATGEGLGTTILRNSIVSSPPTVPNCRITTTPFSAGTFTSEGYNLVSDGSCGFVSPGDQTNVDPLLGPLADNGGGTRTHLPLPVSPAIDTGTPLNCAATDQRGFGRPTDGNGDGVAACDKGAVEAGTALPPPTTGTIRGRAFDDILGDGSGAGDPGLPALMVCVFPTAPAMCVATLPDGSYEFSGLTPGIYSVYARVPTTRYATTPRSLQVTVTAAGVVTNVDFGSQVPPPPPPGWGAPNIEVKHLSQVSFPVRATPPCAASAVTATVSYIGLTVSQAMTNVGGNTWQTFFLTPGGPGVLPVTIVADCSPEPFHAFIIFIDPSGTILDGCTSQPLAGATVRLFKNDPYGSSTYLVPDPLEHLPAINPQTTTGDGVYAWDVVPGRWRIEASKPGYDTVVTDPFDVPPPKLGLDITLLPTAGCNMPPVASGDAYAVDQATVLTVPAPGVLANDTDANGDPLSAVLVTNAGHGSVALSADGSFTYTPSASFFGTDSFTYKAHDGRDDSNVATVTLTIRKVDRPPVARDDAYKTRKNEPFVIFAPGVLGNDSDPEGTRLRATLVRPAARGLVVLSHDGLFVYLPKPGFTGTDTFTYRASDGVQSSNTATVTITVERKKGKGHGHGHDDDDDDDDRDEDDHRH